MKINPNSEPQFQPGLENVVLSPTRLSHVDGARGELLLAGYPVEDIAAKVTFEEMVHLLWTGRLPSATELTAFQQDLAQRRHLPSVAVQLLREAADQPPMDALRMAVGTLSLSGNGTDGVTGGAPTASSADFEEYALNLLAQLPGLVACHQRLRAGLEPLPPRQDLSHAAHFLYQLHGAVPEVAATRALDTYLNTVIDHGANASTFTARVIISTRSDLVSAVVGAIGALKGPLHGGAPGPALDMVKEIATHERAEPFLRAKLTAGERLMGFGHRVYKVRDPRAKVLSLAAELLYAERLYASAADRDLYDLATHVEKTAVALLQEFKPGRALHTNVEFYTALLLHGLGLESELFTPIFAMSRTAGWIAHCREQQTEGRLIRPRLFYQGQRDQPFVPLAERSGARPQAKTA